MAENKSDLQTFKENYSEIQKKYSLPDFEGMNKDFKIEKLADIETDFLIREVRIAVVDTLDNFLRFVEALLNPVNVPMFLFSIIKNLGIEEKNKLMDLHKKISKIEFNAMKLIEFSEDKEAEIIKDSYKLWQEVKKGFLGILEVIESKWENKSPKKNGGYLG